MLQRLLEALPVLPVLLATGCATAPLLQDSSSLESAQHVFFPDRYQYSVGDFVLSLPIGYYEYTMTRLKFAEHILAEGTPKPVTEQNKYLALPSDGLAPARHFLLLDQRHLLVYSEGMSLDSGSPPCLEILKRTSDAGWSDVTEKTVPRWARSATSVKFSPDSTSIHVTGPDSTSRELQWDGVSLGSL
ncbi:hypothetical protein [Verrucomicrobium sp. BvORR106]|uniref:hypothetical protein n=1 Tax=Verrucomicrobium sp. BvORR106 TaxID=1403819 RepID=UPI00057142F4|nr:hypothetical protein [Verrucomicrobium sp. BvORR106]